jgi:hypothetical protein
MYVPVPAQNRTNYGLADREFTGRRRIISNSENDNLVLTTAKGKKTEAFPFSPRLDRRQSRA